MAGVCSLSAMVARYLQDAVVDADADGRPRLRDGAFQQAFGGGRVGVSTDIKCPHILTTLECPPCYDRSVPLFGSSGKVRFSVLSPSRRGYGKAGIPRGSRVSKRGG